MINASLIVLGLVFLVLAPKGKRCPNCRETVCKHDTECEYCNHYFPMVK